MPQNPKQKGDILEKIVEQLCSDFNGSKVTRNITIKGKSGTDRQIDVLIEATQKAFDIKIIVEAKNYASKVGIEKVEALKTKLTDIGGNLGVIVCPLGFTEGAINAAALHDIQLFQAFDHKLGNTTQFVPVRWVIPFIEGYSATIKHETKNDAFELPRDHNQWVVYIDDDIFDLENLCIYAWNKRMFPQQEEGEQIVDFGIRKVATKDNFNNFYHLDLKLNLKLGAHFYAKLFPFSYMKKVDSEKSNYHLDIGINANPNEMIKNGWKRFINREEMEEAVNKYDISEDIDKDIIIVPAYTMDYKIS